MADKVDCQKQTTVNLDAIVRNLEKRAHNALRFCSGRCKNMLFYHENNLASSIKSIKLRTFVVIRDKNSNLSQLSRPKSAKDIAYYSTTTILA
jgi:hypothetical protein